MGHKFVRSHPNSLCKGKMGPLFSGVIMLILGGGVSFVVFGVALIVNYRSERPRSTARLVVMALSTSASFWVGGAISGIIVGWLLSDHGTLPSGGAVCSFFAVSFLGGLIAGATASRLCWRLTEQS